MNTYVTRAVLEVEVLETTVISRNWSDDILYLATNIIPRTRTEYASG